LPHPTFNAAESRAREHIEVPRAVEGRLAALGREEQATLFVTLAAGFMLLVNRYTDRDEVLVGAPVFTPARTTQDAVAFGAAQVVIVRANVAEAVPFRTFLRRVREAADTVFGYPDFPSKRLVAELTTERG